MSGNGWWNLARSIGGNVSVAPVTARHAHRPAACRDGDCPQPLCRVYKEGYEDGYDDGYQAGYGAGYSAGYAAGMAAGGK